MLAGATDARNVDAAGRWSTPAPLTTCSAAASPQITFPQSNPYTRTGLGAIVWGGAPSSCRARTVNPQGLGIAALDPSDRPALATVVGGPATQAVSGPNGVSATCSGRIVIAAGVIANRAPTGVLLEGKPTESFGAPLALGGPPTPASVTRAYRGDIAVASLARVTGGAEAVVLRVQPYNADSMRAPITLSAQASGVDAIAAALDFRADALVVWHRGATVFAREWLQPGRLGPIQRLGVAGPNPQLQALISDNGHAMAVWTDTRSAAGGATDTRIRISVARRNHRFEAAHVIERYTNLAGVSPGEGSIQLDRLSTETVVLAWTGMSRGRYVIRLAPVSIDAVPRGHEISRGSADALLAGLAAGPRGQALALWTSSQRTSRGLDGVQGRLLASTGRIARHFSPRFGAPQLVSAGVPAGAAVNAAYDPTSNRAVAVWRAAGPAAAAIVYALRASDSRTAVHAPPGAAACPALVGHPFRTALEIAAASVAGLVALGLAGWWLTRRTRASR